VAFHVPGDMPDLHSLHLTVMNISMGLSWYFITVDLFWL
jgi:hypothetical protein